MKVFFNADDFGYSPAVNYGIVDAHHHGVVNSTTIMMNMPYADHALDLLASAPELQLGIHLTLTCGSALTGKSSITDEKGHFFRTFRDLSNRGFDPNDVLKEWDAQIELLLSRGFSPSHFDSHHHVHSQPILVEVVKQIARSYNLPTRLTGEKVEGLSYISDYFDPSFYGSNLSTKTLDEILAKYPSDCTLEIMTHPAFIDQHLLDGSSYNLQRLAEHTILTHYQLPSFVE